MLAMAPPAPKPVLLRPADLASRKQAGLPITMLTAWDALSGALVAEAGADAVIPSTTKLFSCLQHLNAISLM